jgi:predicted membrane protein
VNIKTLGVKVVKTNKNDSKTVLQQHKKQDNSNDVKRKGRNMFFGLRRTRVALFCFEERNVFNINSSEKRKASLLYDCSLSNSWWS